MTDQKQSNFYSKATYIFLVLFLYAFVRYIVIKGVALDHLPLFISNKAISLTSVFFIGLSYALGPLGRYWPRMFASMTPLQIHFGLAGFGLGAIHAFMSLLLFDPAYYAKFFEDEGKINLVGELSMMFGVLAFFTFSIIAISSLPSVAASLGKQQWQNIQKIGYTAYFFVMMHVFVMGIKGWLTPSDWPGGLLPISLVAFIIIFLVFLVRILDSLFEKKS